MVKGAATMIAPGLDDRLVRAMREGHEVLPEDLGLLRGYLRLLDGLMAEKAAELEPSWAQALATAAELETLQALEAVVAERAIGVPAADLRGMRVKLEIWRSLAVSVEDGDMNSAGDRLILSILADLDRMQAAGG